MLIFRPDLLCQMQAQRLWSVHPKIIVEISEPWLQHDDLNPDLGGSAMRFTHFCASIRGRGI